MFNEVAASGGIVKAIRIEDNRQLSRKDIDGLTNFVSDYGAKGLAWARVNADGWTSPIVKFLKPEEVQAINKAMEAREGDLIVFVADNPGIVNDALANLRIHVARKLNLIQPDQLAFTWVVEFPLLEYSDTEKRFVAKHHPFTSPVAEDLPLLDTDPAKARARAYDLVLNGTEIGGGSIRIHRTEVQQKLFQTLGMSAEDSRSKFGFLLDALEYGTPPHGGHRLRLRPPDHDHDGRPVDPGRHRLPEDAEGNRCNDRCALEGEHRAAHGALAEDRPVNRKRVRVRVQGSVIRKPDAGHEVPPCPLRFYLLTKAG